MSVTVAEMQRRMSAGLSMKSRAGYTLLLVTAIAMTGITGSLLATERGLPGRTRIAFAVMTLIGAAWTALAGWVLARRHVLFAKHRIAASWLAVAACALFLAGAIAFRSNLPVAAIATAALMMAAALVSVAQARRYRSRLIARRDELVAASRGQL
jgi:hypothetical protein